jgi:predicted short-subunit dehydrogenase-like oxidoreductase (DUF2520 family)
MFRIASAMLGGMRGKPGIAIVGAGNLGSGLAVSLHSAGYEVESIVAHGRGASLSRARRLAKATGSRAVLSVGDCKADVIWFCVPDSQIAQAAGGASAQLAWKGRVALHSSGVLTSNELGALRRRGASVASVHPLMTFVRGSRPRLVGVSFAIEGDAAAVRVARKIVRDLGGRAFSIRKAEKAAYHTWGTFASPLMTALLAATERVADAAGVKGRSAALRMMPILQQTLANYAKLGAAAGFSGPIVRGDVETVRQHLRVLRTMSAARDVYVALARAALEYLPSRSRVELKKLLQSQKR